MYREPQCLVAVLSILVLSGAVTFAQTRPEPQSSLDHVMEQITAVRRFTEVAIAPAR